MDFLLIFIDPLYLQESVDERKFFFINSYETKAQKQYKLIFEILKTPQDFDSLISTLVDGRLRFKKKYVILGYFRRLGEVGFHPLKLRESLFK